MQTAVLVLHILICVILIVLVLLQAGREGMGVVFGGSGNSSVFGSQGAGGILSKLTAFLAVLFVVTSLSYNVMFSSNANAPKSILDVQFEEPIAQPTATEIPQIKTEQTPAATEAPAAQSAPVTE